MQIGRPGDATVRKIWSEVMDDLETGHKKEIESLQRENETLILRAAETGRSVL